MTYERRRKNLQTTWLLNMWTLRTCWKSPKDMSTNSWRRCKRAAYQQLIQTINKLLLMEPWMSLITWLSQNCDEQERNWASKCMIQSLQSDFIHKLLQWLAHSIVYGYRTGIFMERGLWSLQNNWGLEFKVGQSKCTKYVVGSINSLPLGNYPSIFEARTIHLSWMINILYEKSSFTK